MPINITGTFTTTPGTGVSPSDGWRIVIPYENYQTYLSDIFPDVPPPPPGSTIRESTGMSHGNANVFGTPSTSGYGAATSNMAAVVNKLCTQDRIATKGRFDNFVYPSNFLSPPNADSDVVGYLDIHTANGADGFLTIVNNLPAMSGSGFGNTFDFNAVHDKCALLSSTLRQRAKTNLGTNSGNAFYLAYELGNELTTSLTGFTVPKYMDFYEAAYQGLVAGDPACKVSPCSVANSHTNLVGGSGSNIFRHTSSGSTRTWSPFDLYIDISTSGGAILSGRPTIVDVGFHFLNLHPYPTNGPNSLDGTGLFPSYTDIQSTPGDLSALVFNPFRSVKWVAEYVYDQCLSAGMSSAQAAAICQVDASEIAPGDPVDDWRSGTAYVRGWVVYSGGYFTCVTNHTSVSGSPPVSGDGRWIAGTQTSGQPVYAGGENSLVRRTSQTATWWEQIWRQWFGFDPDADGVYLGGDNATRQLSRIIWPFQWHDSPAVTAFKWGLLYWGTRNSPNGPGIALEQKGTPNTSDGPYAKLLPYAGLTDPRGGTAVALRGKAKGAVGVVGKVAVGTTTKSGVGLAGVGVGGRARGTKQLQFSVSAQVKAGIGVAGIVRGTAQIGPGLIAPDPPAQVTATDGQDGYSDISWSASPNDHGNPVSSYVVTRYTSAGVPIDTRVPSPATGLSLRYQPLTNGTAYKFTVHATSAGGVGQESGFSNTITPQGLPAIPPDPPTTVTAVTGPGIGDVTVSWSISPDDHGLTVFAWDVLASSGAVLPSVTRQVVFSNLPAGTYNFQVRGKSHAPDGTVLVGNYSSASNDVDVLTQQFGSGLGTGSVRPLHVGQRTLRGLSAGERSVVAVRAGARSARALHEGNRTVSR